MRLFYKQVLEHCAHDMKDVGSLRYSHRADSYQRAQTPTPIPCLRRKVESQRQSAFEIWFGGLNVTDDSGSSF